jgi:hypothetical protein
MKKTRCWIVLTTLGFHFLVSSLAHSQTVRQIAQKTFPSVVLLVMEDTNGQVISMGSGFFARDGVVVTNHHVLKKARGGYARIVGQNRKYDIRGMVGINSKMDLALLSIKGAKAPSLKLGKSSEVVVGDEVYAVGNPLGLEGTFSRGIVSGIRQIGEETLFQITAPISPGSSGGPILDTRGKVIGVAVATFQRGQNLNFAIPVYYLSLLLSDTKPTKPLSAAARPRKAKSILHRLGGRSIEGVQGGKLIWSYPFNRSGQYSFSLRNRLRNPVKDLYCSVVFYDLNRDPIDVDFVKYKNFIPAGLARRVISSVHGSVQELTTEFGNQTPSTKIEIRVLDFKIME